MPTVPLAVATQELLKKKYEALKAEGKVRSIGVSNFEVKHLSLIHI